MKKSRTSLFRLLILALVIIVTIFILVLAWFSAFKEVSADGMSVKAAGPGLEASFTDTADSEWWYEIFNNDPKAYPLVTGSGWITNNKIDLFVPQVNLSTGEVVQGSDGFWAVRKDEAEAGSDFFETDVYFRSKEELTISISAESTVTPRCLLTDADGNPYDSNLSEFGDFSRDYIAAAARVGFYDEKDNLKFVWAPNKSYELKEGSEFLEIQKNSDGIGGTLNSDPEITFGIKNLPQNKGSDYYYMWEVKTVSGSNNPMVEQDVTNPQGIVMRYNPDTDKFYAALDVSATTQLEHGLYPIKISSPTAPTSYPSSHYADIGKYKDGEERSLSNYTVGDNTYNYIGLYFDDEKYIKCNGQSDSYKWAKLTIDADPNKDTFFNSIDRFQILVEYDPKTNNGNGSTGHMKVAEFAFYNSTNGGYGGGTIGNGQSGSSAYALTDGQKVVITSPNKFVQIEPTFALFTSLDGVSTRDVLLDSTSVTEGGITSNRYRVVPQSLRPASVLTVVKSGETGQYQFKCNIPGESGTYYLYYNSAEDKIGLTDTQSYAAKFELINGSDFCQLKVVDADKYLSISSAGVSLSTIPVDCRIFISQGDASSSSSNRIDYDSTNEEDYTYLIKGTNTEQSLTRVDSVLEAFPTDPKTSIVDDLNFISTISLVTLTKEENSDYYKGHIKIRIWVEGTDREAKTPLINGIFNTKLVFTGTKVPTT
ncbi:MAG: hypothetical protein ACI4RP_01120 [Acutalibacteraceae bacterium]